MTRRIIEEEPYFYTLVADGDSYFLEVCCGRVAIYEVTIRLTEEEKARAEAEPNFTRVLAQSISDNSEKFRDRFV